MQTWHIGCSGFYYKGWKEIFYPKDLPQSKWFSFYCEHFNTLELNVTFYRFPELSFLQNWYKKSPENFSFSIKAPRTITHYKQFHKVQDIISDLYAVIIEGLQDKLGCVLFQLPPKAHYTEEHLDKIIESLDPSFSNVLEFRHVSWWNEKVYEKLAKHHISFCGVSHPQLPSDVIQNTSTLYYRFHGVPDLYKSDYSLDTLKNLVEEVKSSTKTERAFVYFNNDIGGSAIKNTKEMIELI